MSLSSEPEPLVCSECGDAIEEGYLPADDRDGAYEPRAAEAVCTACGFNEVGYAGCAPEVGDVVDPGDGDGVVLLHVDASGDEVEVRSVKD